MKLLLLYKKSSDKLAYKIAIYLCIVVLLICATANAEDANTIKDKINQKQQEIQKLDDEIKEYERKLIEIGRKKNTLESTVRSLDISRRSISAKILKTTKQIEYTNSKINNLNKNIHFKKEQIKTNSDALTEAIRSMHERESDTFIELFLRKGTISDIWDDIETLRQFQETVRIQVNELSKKKEEMEFAKRQAEDEHKNLSDLQKKLNVQKQSLDINRQEKNNILRLTKNKESNYQTLLAKKRKAREEFERELSQYESKLHYILDPSAIPPAGKGVLRWPLAKIHITQYFGNTKFAKSGAYNGKGHNGVDFGTPLGTPVMSASSGTVVETGNTDAFPGCLSYGKWILIKHNNGLSTLYGHLSKRIVSAGQKVATGDVIGYSGSTGFSTGPHLHLSVYASNGVRVVRYGDIRKKSTKCKNAKIPIAPLKAYLNPLDYL